MSPDINVLERVSRVTPFGARFFDTSTQRYVGDGLEIRAWREGDPSRKAVSGFPNRSGTYVIAGAPGLRELEFGAGDDAYWASLAASTKPLPKYRFEVTDSFRRFLPYQFVATLPVREVRDLFALPFLALPPHVSPPEPITYLPLFSAPTRAVPGGLAVMRVELRESTAPTVPAAWALIHAQCNGVWLGSGLADNEGRLTLIFAYPEPPKPRRSQTSPPIIVEATWKLDVRAQYRSRYPGKKAPKIDDLAAIFAQPETRVLQSVAPAVVLPPQELRRDRELVLKSVLKSVASSHLLVEPA